MIKIKEAEFKKISPDYTGTHDGKRSVFAGCIMPNMGTMIAVEGTDFEIVPTPKKRGRNRSWTKR